MTRAEIRTLAKSLVDNEYDDATWNIWINQQINTISGAIVDGFPMTVEKDVVDVVMPIPDYMTGLKKVFYRETEEDKFEELTYYPTPAMQGTEERAYYVANNKINLCWTADGGTVQLFGECTPKPLSKDTDSPDYILPEFHDIIALGAAMLGQIADDEDTRLKMTQTIYNPRLQMFFDKMGKTHRGGTRNLQFKSSRW